MLDHLPILVAVAVAGWAYMRGTRRLWARTGVARPWRAAAFAAGLVTLLLVLVTPLDEASEQRLWAHMVQHEVLVAVAAPLLILANPLPSLLWALSPGHRAAVAPWWRRVSRSHARPRGWAAWAVGALVLQTVAIWAWHAPDLYEAALHSELLHALQHASFLGTALFFWWAVLGARRRSLYGGGALVNFAAALQGVALGAFMTLAGRVWYPTYAAVEGGNLTPLEDQQVAGVIMWGPAGIAYLLAAVLLFAAWLGGSDAEPVDRRTGREHEPRIAVEASVT